MKTALIIGHAGHELRVLKFLQVYKPLVIVLTDGSGNNGKSRTHKSREIFEQHNCKISSIFGKYTDRHMYEKMLIKDTEFFKSLKADIMSILIDNEIGFIFGDACEGFNPTHDVCRYLINSCVKEIGIEKIKNYDFVLDVPANPNDEGKDLIVMELGNSDLTNRSKILDRYTELRNEISMAEKKFGAKAFSVECLRKVEDIDQTKTWDGEKPFYETFGEKRKAEGIYSDIITYENNLLPIIKCL